MSLRHRSTSCKEYQLTVSGALLTLAQHEGWGTEVGVSQQSILRKLKTHLGGCSWQSFLDWLMTRRVACWGLTSPTLRSFQSQDTLFPERWELPVTQKYMLRYFHSKWSKPDRKIQISQENVYIWSLKIIIQMDLFAKQKWLTVENKLMVTKGEWAKR